MEQIRVKAQITVLASLIFVLVLSVVCASVRACVDSITETIGNEAANLAVEAAFSHYTRPLADKYKILLLPSSETLEPYILDVARKNCSGIHTFGQITAESVELDTIRRATDNGGHYFAMEVSDYMKYGVFSEIVQKMMGMEEQLQKDTKAKELVEELTALEEDVIEVDSAILSLVQAVDGIETDESHIIGRGGQPVDSGMPFVKELCYDSVTMERVGVDNAKVYSAMQGAYTDVGELLDAIRDTAEELYDVDEETPVSTVSRLEGTLRSDIKDFQDCVSNSRERCELAISICDDYVSGKNTIVRKAGALQSNINRSKDMLEEAVYKGLKEDADTIAAFRTEDALCDAENIQTALKDILPYYLKLEEYASDLHSEQEQSDYGGVMDTADKAEEPAGSIHYDKLVFDYSNVSFTQDQDNKTMQKLSQKIKKGFLGLVVEDTASISSKKIVSEDWASSRYNADISEFSEIVGSLRENVLYNEYLFENFGSYQDKGVLEEMLDYQIEYILQGEKSDYDNLYHTALELSALREASNFLYLFTDSAKKQECYALSLSIFGFTGIPALVTVGQYAIMAVWAYAESVIDVRDLLKGSKVAYVKTADLWNLSLPNLLKCNLVKDKEGNGGDIRQGFGYEEYLRLLLMMEQKEKKYFYTMDVCEMWMVQQGYSDYRMHNQIYAVTATVLFYGGFQNKQRYISQTVRYNY